MIKSLLISNYALIDNLQLNFSAGLNIITGETGAGKSIMLGALGLLLGARADQRAIAFANRKSVVEGIFSVEGNAELKAKALDLDIEWDDNEMLLRRELAPGGRSRAFINDSPVTLTTLAAIGALLIDIHSQHQNSLLLTPRWQMQVVDTIANNASLLDIYQRQYANYLLAKNNLQDKETEIQRIKDNEGFISYQFNRLDEADLTPNEDVELEEEYDVLANMTGIKEGLVTALDALYEGEQAAVDLLSEATDSLHDIAEFIEGVPELIERIESSRIEIQDIAETLSKHNSNLSADPKQLQWIERRLSELNDLKKQFKADSVEQLIALRNNYGNQLQSIDEADIELDDLRKQLDKALSQASAAAQQLSQARCNAAQLLASQITSVAAPLGMANLRTEISVTPLKALDSMGKDHIEFRFAFNKNQTPAPVSAGASGGEISRLMLSLKSILSGQLGLPTIVFDEVDTGVSGDVASRMGAMMASMGKEIQVITITHLAQVAALGECHFKVYKEDDASATHTRVRTLSDNERRSELALMLSGSATDAAALATADSLLNRRNGKI